MEHILKLIKEIKNIKDEDIIYPERPFLKTYTKIDTIDHFESQIYTKMSLLDTEYEKSHKSFYAYIGLDTADPKNILHQIGRKMNDTNFLSSMQDFRKKCIEIKETYEMLRSILWNTIQKRIGYTDEHLFICSDGTIACDQDIKITRHPTVALGKLVINIASSIPKHSGSTMYTGKGGDA